jgi:hypothetical protein
VFCIDIETCERCGGKVRIIASIEDPAVVVRILVHLRLAPPSTHSSAAARLTRSGGQAGVHGCDAGRMGR